MYSEIVEFIKSLYPNQNPVPLHAPVFLGKEKEYLIECIDTTFVSYVGEFVTRFEEITARYTGAKYAVAVVNGTAALQVALQVAGVGWGDEVITQPLTFVATANAISHTGARPVFVDVDIDTMGLSPEKLLEYLTQNCEKKEDHCINKITGKKVKAIVPMHTFGFPCRIEEIVEIANSFNILVIEDAAESLGSFYKNKHTGTFGLAGILSYNGNKTITTGGGGMIITDNAEIAKKAKHLTTTGKIPHQWEYKHDQVAYNYRMTNLNAAIGFAQMEYLDKVLDSKLQTANLYREFFRNTDITFFSAPNDTIANYWLNVIQLKEKAERNAFLEYSNSKGVVTRPVWCLMNSLEMYRSCHKGNLENSEWLEKRVVNIPSGYRA